MTEQGEYLKDTLPHGLLHAHFHVVSILCQGSRHFTSELQEGTNAVYIHLRIELRNCAPVH